MEGKETSGTESAHSALSEAVVRTLTGLVFGLLVALVVVTASSLSWRPIILLQSWGSDIGLRIFADPIFVPDNGFLETDTPFVFLDIDRDACENFVGKSRDVLECSDPSTPPADLITELVEGLDAEGATAVILDYRLPNPSKITDPAMRVRLERLEAVLTAPDGVPIIAPASLDPVPNVAGVVDRETDRLIEGWSSGRLRLAAFMTWADPETKDGIVRGYPAVLDVQRIVESETTLAYLPSAPFLAALIAEQQQGLAAADAIFYASQETANCDALLIGSNTVIGRSAPFLAKRCADEAELSEDSFLIKPQIFSIYSLSLPASYQNGRSFNDQRLRDLVGAYYGAGTVEGGMLYRRYSVGDFVEEDRSFDRLFQDVNLGKQIVVIGTSAFDAGDWHRTSIGALAGSEVIINATRAFSDFSPLATKKSFASKLWQKVQLTFIAAVVLFFFTWAAVAIARRSLNITSLPLKRWWYFPLASFAVLLSPAIFLAGVGVAMFAVSMWTYGQVATGNALASFDFLLPVLAVAFEGLVEMSHSFLGHVHHWIERRVAHIRNVVRQKP